MSKLLLTLSVLIVLGLIGALIALIISSVGAFTGENK